MNFVARKQVVRIFDNNFNGGVDTIADSKAIDNLTEEKIEFEHDNYFSHQVAQLSKDGTKGLLNCQLEMDPVHLILQINYFSEEKLNRENY